MSERIWNFETEETSLSEVTDLMLEQAAGGYGNLQMSYCNDQCLTYC